ncbi:hypothetical protein B0T25DRAFT_66271 [Lasiosphaeria hispida]|uniref:SH3 domain signaling protein n=1 Tax=Lasiosphaeria hispida TaxID=260671 RepID=A0AAJ0HXF1_9PEZI|nr:hypothetical protein B0T25DRAFT_66271 [Lasiosphaeria hispida]
MQSMQRQFGKLLRKGPGDNAKVSVLLNDYEDADNVLAKLLDGSRAWRDSWVSLVHSQYQIVSEYEGLYDPIVGATDGHGRESAPTPRPLLVRTFKLKEAYGELKTELLQEIAVIDERILKPATDARDSIAPVRKTIKKRENKRMDYEKIQDKATKLQRKPGRTPKEDAALVKAEEEMARVADEFAIADEHIRATLPPIIAAAFSLVPPLVSNLALIQNRLLGLYYTTLNSYCEDLGFPSPPPPMDEVITAWSSAFGPIQRQAESIDFIARGKAINMPMNLTHDPNARKLTAPSTLLPRRSSSGIIPSTNTGPQPRTLRIPSMGSLRQQPEPSPSPVSTYKRPDYLTPTDFTTATVLGGAPIDRTMSRSPGGLSPGTSQGRDYFSNRDRPSTASTDASGVSYGGYSTPTGNGFVKKKPPPPPPKRIPSTKPEEWVVALYAFAGQGQGDLSFREGDRIKIVKRTGTDQDWWVGELNGAKGNFPANYCKAL